MHANNLVLLAAEIVDRFGRPTTSLDWPAFDLESYWTASQRRFDQWHKTLAPMIGHDFLQPEDRGPFAAARPVLEEMLISEIHCRIWTAAYATTDHIGSTRASVSAVRSVWLGHQEARGQVLRLLNQGLSVGEPTALVLNRLRRKTERWSDVILAQLGGDVRLYGYAIDRERIRDFRRTQETGDSVDSSTWPLFMASIAQAFPSDPSPVEQSTAANPGLNREIYEAVSSILPDRRANLSEFDRPRPLFTDRVWQRLEDTSRQMDDWLESYLS